MLWRESQEMELYCMQALKNESKVKKERDAVILAHFYVDGSVRNCRLCWRLLLFK